MKQHHAPLMILILITVLFYMPCGSNCFGEGLRYKIEYDADNGGFFYRHICVVQREGATKGFDGETVWPSPPSPGALLGIRKVSGADEWDADTGWYYGDIREAPAPEGAVSLMGVPFDGLHQDEILD